MIVREEMITAFHAHMVDEEYAQATIEKYQRDVYKLFHFLGEEQEITKEKIMAFKNSLLECYRVSSMNSILVAVNQLLDFLHLHECKVKLFKLQRKLFIEDKDKLDEKEYARLLTTAKRRNNAKLLFIMQTICATGMRISELAYVRVEAIRDGTVIIHNKGKIREIILPGKLRSALRAYAYDEQIKKGPIFITSKGKPMDRSNIWHMMKCLCKEAGVARCKVFPHNLRRLFAFTFYRREKDLVRLADILGHSCIETTRIYTKSSLRECRDSLERMDMVYFLRV